MIGVIWMTASKRGIKLDAWDITWDEYKELDYFCRQYERKRRDAAALLTLRVSTAPSAKTKDDNWVFLPHGSGGTSDPVAAAAEKRERLLRDVQMIEKAARLAGDEFAPYLLRAVTRRDGVNRIIADGCPCSERTFYRMRRRFFFVLRELRNAGAA